MHFNPSDIIGSTGVALLLLAFALNLAGKLDQKGIVYSGMNFIGAGLAALASWMINYIPFVVLEGTWCLVSLLALLRAGIQQRHSDSD
ncbi:CBU_0592 family membrane protein [Hirschia maritima]|uniref:CBU_0592 family membrane protein n=1 Tax=Hirschia maritima TaxID=1121961 RepID=UPI000375817F|nr:hypothetical protein [Hirschia maritima]